jgi:hypothetical protein
MPGKTVRIDLETTSSVFALMESDQPAVIVNQDADK